MVTLLTHSQKELANTDFVNTIFLINKKGFVNEKSNVFHFIIIIFTINN